MNNRLADLTARVKARLDTIKDPISGKGLFTAGRVTLTGTIAGTPGTLRIDWTQCGKFPTRTFIPS